jgi:predicted nucleic acid-binding protein
MKSLIFDSGPIISLTLTHLMWTLDLLKKQFNGNFYIPLAVKKELIDIPLESKRFKFEALHTLRYIKKNTITIYCENNYEDEKNKIMYLANNIFSSEGSYIQIIHDGEAEVLALAKKINAEAIVIDERTTRELIENPWKVKELLSVKLHRKVDVNQENFDKLRNITSSLKVIRSVELIIANYHLGILDRYLPEGEYNKETLLDAIITGLKLNGCAIPEENIPKLIEITLKK